MRAKFFLLWIAVLLSTPAHAGTGALIGEITRNLQAGAPGLSDRSCETFQRLLSRVDAANFLGECIAEYSGFANIPQLVQYLIAEKQAEMSGVIATLERAMIAAVHRDDFELVLRQMAVMDQCLRQQRYVPTGLNINFDQVHRRFVSFVSPVRDNEAAGLLRETMQRFRSSLLRPHAAAT